MSSNVTKPTIYTWPGNPRAIALLAIANFNGLDVAVPKYDLNNRDEAFYAKFPFGKVPALSMPDGFNLVESNAIGFYLASLGSKVDQLVGGDIATKARIQQWIFHNEGEIVPNLYPFVMTAHGRKEKDEKAEPIWAAALERSFTYINKHLETNKWLAGTQDISLADLTLLTGLLMNEVWGKRAYFKEGELEQKFPKVAEWFERVKAVPEVKAAIDADGVKE